MPGDGGRDREEVAGENSSPRIIWERPIFKFLSDMLASFSGSLETLTRGKLQRNSSSLEKSRKHCREKH
jgi:hypothetical protein